MTRQRIQPKIALQILKGWCIISTKKHQDNDERSVAHESYTLCGANATPTNYYS